MSGDEFKGVLRAVVPAILMWVSAKGLIPGEQVAELGAALVTIIFAGWSIVSKRKTA